MHTFPKNEEIQQHGCRALYKLFEKGICILCVIKLGKCLGWDGTADTYLTEKKKEFLHFRLSLLNVFFERAQNRFSRHYHKTSELDKWVWKMLLHF